LAATWDSPLATLFSLRDRASGSKTLGDKSDWQGPGQEREAPGTVLGQCRRPRDLHKGDRQSTEVGRRPACVDKSIGNPEVQLIDAGFVFVIIFRESTLLRYSSRIVALKHQYFGDVNDYRKYSLLKCLSGQGRLQIGVCWMLTTADKRSDGNMLSYLGKTDQYRAFAPDLFDYLFHCIYVKKHRHVSLIEASQLLPSSSFHSAVLLDDIDQRRVYFAQMFQRFAKVDLVFFDPDNGLEVKSKPIAARDLQSIYTGVSFSKHMMPDIRFWFINISPEKTASGASSASSQR
jgi:hypothetical protein